MYFRSAALVFAVVCVAVTAGAVDQLAANPTRGRCLLGDSIIAGSDDEHNVPFPPSTLDAFDERGAARFLNNWLGNGGIRGYGTHAGYHYRRTRNGGGQPSRWGRSYGGSGSNEGGATEMDRFAWCSKEYIAIGVNDSGASALTVCSLSGAICTMNATCPFASAGETCGGGISWTSGLTQGEIATLVSLCKSRGHQCAVFMSPCYVNRIDVGGVVSTHMDGTADSVSWLFEDASGPFFGDPDVSFHRDVYDDFCRGSGQSGCTAAPTEGPVREMFFSNDLVLQTNAARATLGGARWCHPSGLGYAHMAAIMAEAEEGESNAMPTSPALAFDSATSTSITFSVTPGTDSDGPAAVTTYAWPVCVLDPTPSAGVRWASCDGNVTGDAATGRERECGPWEAGDIDGDDVRDFQVVSSTVTFDITNCSGCTVKACGCTWDGARCSYVSSAEGDLGT